MARAKEQGLGLLAMKSCVDVPGEQWEDVMAAIIADEHVHTLVRTVTGKADVEPTLAEARPKSQDELDADAYCRSVGLLPPEGEAAQSH